MNRTRWIWIALGGIALLAIGLLIGLTLTAGGAHIAGWGYPTMMGGWPGAHMGSWGMMHSGFGWGIFPFFGWLMMLLFLLGPIAGIAALIIVLRRPAQSPPTPPTAQTPRK